MALFRPRPHFANNPCAEVISWPIGRNIATMGGATVHALVPPARAAEYAIAWSTRPSGIAARALLVVITRVPIRAPLPDVSVHVVKTEGIRGIRANLRRRRGTES